MYEKLVCEGHFQLCSVTVPVTAKHSSYKVNSGKSVRNSEEE
jgi:hypothetical protein